jgi:hypothetical protein
MKYGCDVMKYGCNVMKYGCDVMKYGCDVMAKVDGTEVWVSILAVRKNRFCERFAKHEKVTSFKPSVNIVYFWQCRLLNLTCRLLNLTTYFGINLKKPCPEGQYEQLFFKYFPIYTFSFEKM